LPASCRSNVLRFAVQEVPVRIRITHQPSAMIDGIPLSHFEVGAVYDVGTRLSCVFLAEGWAEPVPAEASVPSAALPGGFDVKDRVVLVVDDDPAVRELLQDLLTSEGFIVVIAQHGAEAIARLHEGCPDVILLDLQMPIMDGWQFRSEQRRLADERLARVPIVVLSSELAAGDHALALNAEGVVPKPFEPIALLGVIRDTIRSGAA
jgi:CheY-like chemotaxis protein